MTAAPGSQPTSPSPHNDRRTAYDVEIAIRRTTYPLRVTGVSSETRAFEIVDRALAAWGIPVPVGMRDSALFATQLAARGSYSGTTDGARVRIERTSL